MVLLRFSRLHRHGEDCKVGSCPGDDHWQPAPVDTGGWASYQDKNPSTVAQKSKVLSPDESTAGLQLVLYSLDDGVKAWGTISSFPKPWPSFLLGELALRWRWGAGGEFTDVLHPSCCLHALFSWTCWFFKDLSPPIQEVFSVQN